MQHLPSARRPIAKSRLLSTLLSTCLHTVTALTIAAVASPIMAMPAQAWSLWGVREPEFHEVIQRVTRMPQNVELQRQAHDKGLGVVNVMWEDTGRYEGSSVGPNISDLTLQVHHEGKTHLLPVIRHPNFTDKTADVAADKLWVRVGNQHASTDSGAKPAAMPLTEVLSNLKEYLSDPGSLEGTGNLLAARDTHFLVSAQHVFVPLSPASGKQGGKVEFNPVLFNYQSAPESPAVLTLLITREGMSATVIENRNEEMSQAGWGQQLFYNNAGQKTLFTAERKSAVKARIESGQAKAADQGALEEGADMMMIAQVPLKHKSRVFATAGGGYVDCPNCDFEAPAMEMAAPMARSGAAPRRSDVEQAVLGHGEDLGKFEEMRGLKLERDERFPVRVTVQFYKATSNGVVDQGDLEEVANTIAKVYESADYVGSLVVPKSEQKRPTAWERTGGRNMPPIARYPGA